MELLTGLSFSMLKGGLTGTLAAVLVGKKEDAFIQQFVKGYEDLALELARIKASYLRKLLVRSGLTIALLLGGFACVYFGNSLTTSLRIASAILWSMTIYFLIAVYLRNRMANLTSIESKFSELCREVDEFNPLPWTKRILNSYEEESRTIVKHWRNRRWDVPERRTRNNIS